MRRVLRRVKSAVRIRDEQEPPSCHGVNQHASAGKPDRDLVVARDVLAGVTRLLHLCRDEGGGVGMGRDGCRPLDAP